MKNVYPQNVEENKKRDEQERLKEKRALKRQQKIDAVTKTSFFKRLNVILDSKAFYWFGVFCWVYLTYKAIGFIKGFF